jgi:prolyl-tRNA synthetase
VGNKAIGETFPGAQHSYTIEALLQDKKALQAGTSHHLGTTFAKAFEVEFIDNDGKMKPVWATSWGVSTRLIGALIMTHSDDKGLVLPPKIASVQVIVIPIWKNDTDRFKVNEVSTQIASDLAGKGYKTEIDDRDSRSPGWRFTDAERSGVPIRLEIGPRDLANRMVTMVRRDNGVKRQILLDGVVDQIIAELSKIQSDMLERSRKRLLDNTTDVTSLDELKAFAESDGGFARVFLDTSDGADGQIRDLKAQSDGGKSLGITVRCILQPVEGISGKCIVTGRLTTDRVIIAKAY